MWLTVLCKVTSPNRIVYPPGEAGKALATTQSTMYMFSRMAVFICLSLRWLCPLREWIISRFIYYFNLPGVPTAVNVPIPFHDLSMLIGANVAFGYLKTIFMS